MAEFRNVEEPVAEILDTGRELRMSSPARRGSYELAMAQERPPIEPGEPLLPDGASAEATDKKG